MQLGKPVEITEASIYGYEGGLFENGAPITTRAHLNLPCLHSLTSDKFVRTTDLSERKYGKYGGLYFMYLKKPQDFLFVSFLIFYLTKQRLIFLKKERIDFFCSS